MDIANKSPITRLRILYVGIQYLLIFSALLIPAGAVVIDPVVETPLSLYLSNIIVSWAFFLFTTVRSGNLINDKR